MTTHTPGPWETYVGGNFIEVWRTGYKEGSKSLSQDQGAVATIKLPNMYGMTLDRDSNPIPSEFLANACLIAAAPELLEALQAIDEIYWKTNGGDLWKVLPDLMRQARDAIQKATFPIQVGEGNR